MTPRLDDIEALARAIDRLVFPEAHPLPAGPERQTVAQAVVSYLNESFPRAGLPAQRRERLLRRLMRALDLPQAPSTAPWARLEDEMNRRLRSFDPRWTPVVGGAAIVLLGVLGIAYLRQRSGVKGIAAILS
jgi:hypothetical protein